MPARPRPVVPVAVLAGFLALWGLVAGGWPVLERVDATTAAMFRDFGADRPGLIAVLRVATDVAATVPYAIAGILTTALLAWRGARAAAWLAGLTTAAVPAAWGLFHWLMHRPRPADAFVTTTSNGFPSGHTSHATAAAAVAVALLWRRLDRTGRAVAAVLAGAFALAIGATRVVLLAHWTTDVVGAWLLGAGLVAGLAVWRWPAAGPPAGAERSVSGGGAAGRPSRPAPP